MNVALVMGVVGALQVLPVVGSVIAIAFAKTHGKAPDQEPKAGRPRRAVMAEALGWVGLAIFVISVVGYLLR